MLLIPGKALADEDYDLFMKGLTEAVEKQQDGQIIRIMEGVLYKLGFRLERNESVFDKEG